MEEEKKPWDRLADESAKLFELFAAYRDMGSERSITKLAAIRGNNEKYFFNVSTKYRWRERAAAYDDWLDKESQKKNLEKCTQLKEASLTAAMKMMQLAMGAMKDMTPNDLSPKEVKEYVRNALAIAECFADPKSNSREIVDEIDQGGDTNVIIYLPEVDAD